MTLDLLGFLTLGLLGGFGHCIGMCSPFVLFVSRRYAPGSAPGSSLEMTVSSRPGTVGSDREGSVISRRGSRARAAFAAQLWYTAGRVVTYAVLGLLAGTLGAAVESAGALLGLRRAAGVVAGAVLVAWGIAALSDLPAFQGGGRLFSRVTGMLKGRVPGHPFATGLFLGLLPCGFLYSAVTAAVARGGPLEGAAALALFGVGTAPALLGVSLADDLLARRRAFVNRLSQVFILAMGGWFLWKALLH